MIGQVTSLLNKKYNIIILAGGLGTRMGVASDYLPKALSKIGSKRAIDYIIERYSPVAHKFIIGTAYHADLLESYIKGNYSHLNIEFSHERVEDLKNAGVSTLFCLDKADSRYGTIICFCDLLMISNSIVNDDTIYYADKETKGNIGTFRHSIKIENNNIIKKIEEHNPPVLKEENNGVLGVFCFSNTFILKAITYAKYDFITDLTFDIVRPYNDFGGGGFMNAEHCDCVYEFGDENNLQEVRKLWENS